MPGRFVIVQMDNGQTTPLNLKEVKASGNIAEHKAQTYLMFHDPYLQDIPFPFFKLWETLPSPLS